MIEPLTKSERAWVRRLERVFADMPERLLLVESACALMVVDREAARDVEMADGGASRAGIVLHLMVHGTSNVQGVS